jgi:pimeloyl-ACP methyl ester carboxylesterase
VKKGFRGIYRFSFAVFCGICLMLLAGFVYERIARSTAAQRFQAGGEMIDINDHRLHVVREGTLGPTVVFEAGLDPGGHLSWILVQGQVARFARTVSYDRAGVLWSERGSALKSCDAIAGELHTLLEAMDLEKPYYLVGHSFAALTFRCFISRYGVDVGGVVLVEPSHPDLVDKLPPEAVDALEPAAKWQLRLVDNIGLHRLFYNTPYPRTDPALPFNQIFMQLKRKSFDAVYEELINIQAIAEDAARVDTFGEIPLIVISAAAADRSAGMWSTEELAQDIESIWHDIQLATLSLSDNSRQVFAANSGHYIQLEEPEIVSSAVLSLVSDVILREPLDKDGGDATPVESGHDQTLPGSIPPGGDY